MYVTSLLIPFSPEAHFRDFACCKIGRRHPHCPEPLWPGDCADVGEGGALCFTHTFPSLYRGSGPADTSSCSHSRTAHRLKGACLSVLQFQCSLTGETGGWSESIQSFSFWTSPSSEPPAGFWALRPILAPRTSLAAQPPHPTPITPTFSPFTLSV